MMTPTTSKLLCGATLLTTLLALHTMSVAQSYPVKPLRIIVPFPPDGSVDVIARMSAPKL